MLSNAEGEERRGEWSGETDKREEKSERDEEKNGNSCDFWLFRLATYDQIPIGYAHESDFAWQFEHDP